MLRAIRRVLIHSVPTDESIEVEAGKQEKGDRREESAEVHSKQTSQTPNQIDTLGTNLAVKLFPGLESHNRHISCWISWY